MLVVINDKAVRAEKVKRIEVSKEKYKGAEFYRVVAIVDTDNYIQEITLKEFASIAEATKFMKEVVDKINNKNEKLEIVEVHIDGDYENEIFDWMLETLPTFLEEYNHGKEPEWDSNTIKACGIKIEKDPDRRFLTVIGERKNVEGLISKIKESYLEVVKTQLKDMFSDIETIYEGGEECL